MLKQDCQDARRNAKVTQVKDFIRANRIYGVRFIYVSDKYLIA